MLANSGLQVGNNRNRSRIMDRGSRIVDHGSCIKDHGSRITDHGSWITDQGVVYFSGSRFLFLSCSRLEGGQLCLQIAASM